MQDIVDTYTSFSTSLDIPNIGLKEPKSLPLLGSNISLNFIKITLMAGCEVIEPDNILI
ncbi:hypothetical protein D3C77_405330 [compost metagenome]